MIIINKKNIINIRYDYRHTPHINFTPPPGVAVSR